MQWKKFLALAVSASICIGALAGCGGSQTGKSDAGKVLTIGDTTFNSSNEEPDINPHNAYAGWFYLCYV